MKIICSILFLALILSGLSCTNASSKDNAIDRSSSKGKQSGSSRKDDKKDPISTANVSPTVAYREPEIAQAMTPEELVKDLYKQHDAENSPFFQTKNRQHVEKFFVKSLAGMIWKDSENSEGEVGALDFDPMYNGQDFEISEFEVGIAEIKGEKASLKVDFLNFGEAQTITFKLAKEKGLWKIEDIDYGDFTLVGIFNENG